MDDLKKFKQYFNRDFWRVFQDKQSFFDIPKNMSRMIKSKNQM